MEILTKPIVRINQWDKDSIRPGPVGSVGDVNLQVKLKKSAPDMADRYDYAFSGKNEVWSGSNVSDGMWYGFTSGGRAATTLTQPWNNRDGFKTAVGYRFQNIVPTDRTRETKVTPLGRYGWDTTVGSVLKAKVSGDLFLPHPEGYRMTGPPRGSHFPRIIETSAGTGVALPAADVPITDPLFGDIGTIERPGQEGCTEKDRNAYWTPAEKDPLRQKHPLIGKWRYAYVIEGGNINNPRDYRHDATRYPYIGPDVLAYQDNPFGSPLYMWAPFNPCGLKDRPASVPPLPEYEPPTTLPKPGNQDRRREDRKKEKEAEKKKKQKIR